MSFLLGGRRLIRLFTVLTRLGVHWNGGLLDWGCANPTTVRFGKAVREPGWSRANPSVYGVYQIGGLPDWRFPGLAVCRIGGLPDWRFTGLSVYWIGGLPVGGLPNWWFTGLAVYRIGGLLDWRFTRLAVYRIDG